MDWQVTYDLDTDVDVDDHDIDALLQALAPYGGAVSALGRELSITLTIENGPSHPDLAGEQARTIALQTLDVAQLGMQRERALEVLTVDEADRREAEPTLPPLVGAAEAADMLGVSRQRIHQLHTDNPRFPRPAVQVRMGPLWTKASIEAFDRAWTRKPGRPAAARPNPMTDALAAYEQHVAEHGCGCGGCDEPSHAEGHALRGLAHCAEAQRLERLAYPDALPPVFA